MYATWIEDPFDQTANALDLDAIVQTIECAVLEQLGQDVPGQTDHRREIMAA
jgi:predicted membrane chloride channel (bestrophin family)